MEYWLKIFYRDGSLNTMAESVILYFIINTLCINRRGRYAKWILRVIYFLLRFTYTYSDGRQETLIVEY